MTHKLNSPHEWLLEKAQHWNTNALYNALSGLASRLDGQSIRDLFHPKWTVTAILTRKQNQLRTRSTRNLGGVTDGIHDG